MHLTLVTCNVEGITNTSQFFDDFTNDMNFFLRISCEIIMYLVKCKVGQGQISKTRLKMSDKPFMKMKWYFKVFILN